ncbi:acyltransferase family protein [Noviherbaspirillum humi]|nr:acyltransferase [Noviherbaspirillum humi]
MSAVSKFDKQYNSRAIDALRGYAILFVICMHVLDHVPSLVWPAKRLLLLGTHGVQLFFIASAVTLLMSWSREQDHLLAPRTRRFLINRFFRIAPLYFSAIVFYWFFENVQLVNFSTEKLLATLLFYNSWSPYLIPTVGGWKTVPGGWSISVEFMFYLLFPLLAQTVTTLRRAVLFLAISYAVMLGASIYGQHLYPEISLEARENFLFYWPPNQLVVFALGFVLYRAIKSSAVSAWVQRSLLNANNVTVLLSLALLLAQFHPGKVVPLLNFLLPKHLLLSLLFTSWALFLILKPSNIAAPKIVGSIGKMSFSIYLIHFATLAVVSPLLARAWPLPTTGVASISYVFVLLGLAVLISYQVARHTYRLIEKPFIQYGKSLFIGGSTLFPRTK